MVNDIGFREVERRVAQSFYEDGLIDICLGILLLAQGITSLFSAWTNENVWQRTGLYLGIVAIGGAIYLVGKKYITQPRMGRVKPGAAGKTRRKKLRLLTVIIVLVSYALLALVLIAGASGWDPLWLPLLREYTIPVVFGLMILIFFGLAAHFTAHGRLWLIGIVFAVALLLSEVLLRVSDAGFGALPFLVGGMLVLAIGLWTLRRFTRKYPVWSAEDMAGN